MDHESLPMQTLKSFPESLRRNHFFCFPFPFFAILISIFDPLTSYFPTFLLFFAILILFFYPFDPFVPFVVPIFPHFSSFFPPFSFFLPFLPPLLKRFPYLFKTIPLPSTGLRFKNNVDLYMYMYIKITNLAILVILVDYHVSFPQFFATRIHFMKRMRIHRSETNPSGSGSAFTF